MENKHVGFLILGISIILIIIVLLFQTALNEIVIASCGAAHTTACPMSGTINQQTYLALAIVGVLIVIGFVLIFSKPKERIIVKKIKEKKKKLDLKGLDKDEKRVINLLMKEGAMFQSTLMEKLEIRKVKTTRLLDKLEAKQLIERKRRGMNNIVVIRD